MFLARLSIEKPVGTVLVSLTAVLLGVLSVKEIPVSFWPDFIAPTLIILAPYPGASPEEIEEQIVVPLERELSTLDEIDEIESSCENGFARLYVRFGWGIDFDKIKLKVQEKTNQASTLFPKDAPRPTVLQVQDFLPPGMEIGFYSDQKTLNEVRDFVEQKLEIYFLRLPEVASVQTYGGYKEEIQVNLDPVKLMAYGVSSQTIIAAIRNNHRNLSVGELESRSKNYSVRILGKYQELEEIGNTIVSNRNRIPVYLNQVAKIELAPAEESTITHWNGREIVVLTLREKSSGSTIAMCTAAIKQLEAIKNLVPEDINVFILSDQSVFIKRSINNVIQNALIGAAIAACIVFLFLGNLRNFLVIAISIPASVISAFFLIRIFGLTVNTISLGGLALSVGLIVDASVVITENIFRRLQGSSGEDRTKTVLEAVEEVGSAVIASTLTSVVVFFPLAFLIGLFAVLLGELALTVVFALCIALLISLSLVPLLAHRFMKIESGKEEQNYVQRIFNQGFQRLQNVYLKFLKVAIKRPFLTVLVSFLLLAAIIIFLTPLLDVELLPAVNESEFNIDIQFPEGTRLEYTASVASGIEKHLQAMKEIEQVFTTVGVMSARGEEKENYASVKARLKEPYVKRASLILANLREEFSTLPVSKIKIYRTDVTAGFRRNPVDIRISGDDLETLSVLGRETLQWVRRIPGIINISGNIQEELPRFVLKLNHERLAFYGLSATQVASAVSAAQKGVTLSDYSVKGREIDIHVRFNPEDVDNLDEIMNIPVARKGERIITLGAVASAEIQSAPATIKRLNQQRFVEITADISGRSVRETLAEIRRKASDMALPEGYFLFYGGQSKGITDSFRSLTTALLIALALVYVILGGQFNSFIQPLIIGVSIPLAIIGVILGLLLFNVPLSINAMLGTIMLVGIVVNNGILLIDQINRLRESGRERREAISEACSNRLRPILITSLTTIFGIFPIALGIGSGGEALKPLGAVVVGGLTTSTFLTLLVLPAIYILIDNLKKKPETKPTEEKPPQNEPLLPYV